MQSAIKILLPLPKKKSQKRRLLSLAEACGVSECPSGSSYLLGGVKNWFWASTGAESHLITCQGHGIMAVGVEY